MARGGCDGPVAYVGLPGSMEGTYRHTRVGGPRAQQCGDARTWSKRQPRRCWELQADKIVVCGTQAWSLYPCYSLFRLRASSTVHAGPHGHGDTPGVPHALLGKEGKTRPASLGA